MRLYGDDSHLRGILPLGSEPLISAVEAWVGPRRYDVAEYDNAGGMASTRHDPGPFNR